MPAVEEKTFDEMLAEGKGRTFDEMLAERQVPKTIHAQPVPLKDQLEAEALERKLRRQPFRADLPGPQLLGGTPADLGPSEPKVRYQRQLEERRRKIQEQESLERFYEAHPKKRPRKYKNFIDELLRNTGGGILNVASGGIGTLASVSEGAIWDPDQLEELAQKLYRVGEKPTFTPAEGGGWRGFVAASIGQAAPYMGAAVGATLTTGTPLAAFGVGYAVEGDNAYRDAIEAGASEEEAQMNRFIVGTINATIEMVQVSQVFKFAKAGKGSVAGIRKAAQQRALKKVLQKGGKIGYEAAKHSVREALEEVLQETTQIVAISKHDPKVWDTATQRILMSGLGGGTVGLILGGGGRVMTNMRAKAEAGKLTPQQLDVMNQTKTEYDAIVAEGGIGAKQKAEEAIRKGQGKLAALEGEEAAAAFEAEVAEMDRELKEIQRPVEKAPESPSKPSEKIPPPVSKEAPKPAGAMAVPPETPTGEVIEPAEAPAGKAVEVTPKDQKIIKVLRKAADSLQKTIDYKRHPAVADQNITRRRAGQIASAANEADRLERQQQALRAIAYAKEAGTLPESLKEIKNRTEVESILQGYFSLPDMHKTNYFEVLEVTKGVRGAKSLKEDLRYIRVTENRAVFTTPGEIAAIEKLIKMTEVKGRRIYHDITEGKRFIRLGIKSKAEHEQVRKDLESIMKPKPKEVPAERQIREKTAELIGVKIPGFFPTPKPVIKNMLERADISEGMSVLEPSAGKGDIADVIKEEGVEPDVIEIIPSLQEILELKGHKIVGTDFLEHDGKYDRIIMNPPFEKGQDIEHVKHAYELLKPGGKLVSIMSESPFFRSEKKYQQFRDWFDDVDGESEKLTQAFKGKEAFRQTGVSGRIVVIDKPTPSPAEPTGEVIEKKAAKPPSPAKPAGEKKVVNIKQIPSTEKPLMAFKLGENILYSEEATIHSEIPLTEKEHYQVVSLSKDPAGWIYKGKFYDRNQWLAFTKTAKGKEAITPEIPPTVPAKPTEELWKMTKAEFDTIAQSVSQKWDTGFKVKSTGKIINTGPIHALPKGYKESSLIPGFINVETGRFFTRQEHKNFVSLAEHQLDQIWRVKKRRGTPWDVHEKEVQEAIDEGKPVPREVLEEYKTEKWAQEALAKPAKKAEVEVKSKVPEGEISRKPVTVEGKKYYPITLPTDQIGVDAAKFQFKLGAKLVGGVTEALKGVEKYDPVKGGQILVWQDKAGKYWVVDGHHRVALAKKTGAETLETWIVSEKDGVTEQDARAIGALRNLADGKGTAVDAAKLFRDSNISLEELRKNAVPTESTIVQQGLDMTDLSDEVFRLVIDERLPANMAATIGKQVKNPTQQKQVSDLILEGEVETLRQAELLAATIDSAPVLTKTEQTLFGLETTEKSLYAERAKILANVEKKLKLNKKIFGVLATQTGVIEAKGNILAKVENLATKEKAEEVLFMLEKLANSKGPIAEALNDATKQYAENPTKENLSKVTSELLEKWTEGPGRLRVPERQGVPELPLERAAEKVATKPQLTTEELIAKDRLRMRLHFNREQWQYRDAKGTYTVAKTKEIAIERANKYIEGKLKPKGKPGFVDVRPLEKALKTSLKVVEPAKITQRAFGKKPGAIIIKGIHQADVGRIEFNEAEIEALDTSLGEFGEKLSRYSNKVLKNLMAARGKPVGAGAILVKNEALKDLAKKAPELIGVRKMITRIADHNYKYLQSVVGDDIHYVEDYFYGIYKDTEKATVENFLDYWHTTDRFTKQKKLPTVADAIAYGLELRDYNPVNNLRSEYMAIARLDGMIYMRDELMRTGKGRYIDTKEDAPHDWEKIQEPVFKDVRVHPEAAVMIKSLLSTNKLRRHWALRGLTHTNNALRTLKFVFSMFHQLNIAKQSVADEGYLKFLQPSATRGITRGFKKSDPIFRTPAYKDYIRHGGGHRYSIESQAQRAFTNFVESLDKRLGFAFKLGALPIRIPKAYVKWMFQSYIPKVKYSKYLDSINKFEEKNGRTPTSVEKIEILKEQQNFYGMMNERLFGRSGTVTSLMRLWYMSPGYFEGNFRSILKSILQWGGKEGHKASRSRSNIINSLILSGIAATVTTLIMTGKPPKKPETREDLRDLFKGDTGKVDDKGRRIMVDFLTYDRDYWNILGQALIGKPDKAADAVIKRGAGMVAPSAQVALDIANIAAGRALVDWKNDRVTEVTDPFARKVLKIAIHEIKRTEPISMGVYSQSRRRDQTAILSALTALLGYRPTLTEKDKREQEVLHRIYSLKGQQEKLYQYLGGLRNPRKDVENYNKNVKDILDSPMTPKIMKARWEPKLIIDVERLLENKAYALGGATQKPEDIERAVKYLKNFGVTQDEIENYIRRKRAREIKKTPISPLDRDRVIGLMRRIRRAKERIGQ